MEKVNNRTGYSGRLVKNKNSSGCLIIKKKPDVTGGVGSCGSQKPYQLKKGKKRPQALARDSSSSDDDLLQVYRRRGVSGGNRGSSASVVYKKGTVEESEFSRGRNNLEYGEMSFDRSEVREGGRKRSKLDVYDFDEYDDLTDIEMIGRGRFGDREAEGSGRRFLGMKPVINNSCRKGFETGSGRYNMIDRRKASFLGSTSGEKIGVDGSLVNKRFESKNKGPIGMLKERFGSPDEAIRLQGKNGVLKLIVNHNNKVNGPLKPQSCKEAGGNTAVSMSNKLTRNNIILHRSSYSEKQVQHEPNKFDRVEKEKPRSRKLSPAKSSESSDEQSEENGAPSNNISTHRSMKRGRSEVGDTPPERLQPARLMEAKVKRGSGTEKQLLREKIRSMLVTAGWTIDYRRRRNRDYFDAVYINPTGTAYWSIIKAYDALLKQLEDERANVGSDCSPFAPISEEILSKLTRQTQKKIEKELKRKRKNNVKKKRKKEGTAGKSVSVENDMESSDSGRHDEKLSSFIKLNGKSMKSRSHDARYGEGSISMSKVQERFPFHGRKSKKIGRCTLLVRNSEKGLNSEDDGFVPYKGKRTVLSWLIDSGTVNLSEQVHYMNRRRTRIMLEGWITRDGIHCGCCSKILTVSKFEIHAASKLRQPFQNIYLSSGISLLQCQLDAWNRQDESLCRGFHAIDVDGDDPNDDTCGICGDGGDLICCDGCPSTFHQNCLGIKMLPPGDWHCSHCSCKLCGQADLSTAEENGTTCALLTCCLCERKYHNSCIQEMGWASISSSTPSMSFCGLQCQELFEQLQKLLGVKHELDAGLSWSLIHRTDLDSDTSLRGFSHRVEWNSKLAVALTVMDECFLPIVDRRSGINLIHNVVYNCGSNFHRLNYSGFYTAILERGDEIISAASIRIHGPQLAEMPYIGTRHIYRRQGMFRQLFSAIESAFRCLKVEKLVIPAISELMHTWTTVFGFSAIEESHKQEMKSINMLAFPGTDMLQKKLVEQETPSTDIAVCTGRLSPKVDVMVPDSMDKSDLEMSPGDDAGGAVLQNDQINHLSSADFSLQVCAATLNETSVFNASSDASKEAKASLVCYGGSQGPLSSMSELEDKESEFIADVKVHYTLVASTEVPRVKSSLGSPPKYRIEVSSDCKDDAATQDKVADTDSGSQKACLSLKSTSLRNTPLHGSQAIKNPIEGTLHSTSGLAENVESFSDIEHSSVLNAGHGALVGKPTLGPPTVDNIEQPLGEREGG
ncbi:hypothetical protein Ancab_030391 [Ancistrocladus abbreviatus]